MAFVYTKENMLMLLRKHNGDRAKVRALTGITTKQWNKMCRSKRFMEELDQVNNDLDDAIEAAAKANAINGNATLQVFFLKHRKNIRTRGYDQEDGLAAPSDVDPLIINIFSEKSNADG